MARVSYSSTNGSVVCPVGTSSRDCAGDFSANKFDS